MWLRNLGYFEAAATIQTRPMPRGSEIEASHISTTHRSECYTVYLALLTSIKINIIVHY